MKEKECVIEVKSLRKVFGEVVAVQEVSFEVRGGECFGILGPNGAGKTSTIRVIYGFSPPSGGTVKVFGLDVCSHWRIIRSRIGVCQQDNSLDPDLSVRENLEVFARYFEIPRSEARKRAQELLEFVGLDRKSGAKVSQLSGGMMRRLVLARALINGPELLILDEPTTGLDPQSRHQVWSKLEALKGQGISIVLTTHYMEEASRLCDRIIIMDHGRILDEGSPQELIQRHVGREVMEVTNPTRALRQKVKELGLQYEDLGHRIVIYVESADKLFRDIGRDVVNGDVMLRMATLEDVFLKLTGRELRE